MQTLNPYVPFLFLRMICKKKKLSLDSIRYGWYLNQVCSTLSWKPKNDGNDRVVTIGLTHDTGQKIVENDLQSKHHIVKKFAFFFQCNPSVYVAKKIILLQRFTEVSVNNKLGGKKVSEVQNVSPTCRFFPSRFLPGRFAHPPYKIKSRGESEKCLSVYK